MPGIPPRKLLRPGRLPGPQRRGSVPDLRAGFSVRVAGVDVTGYIRANSRTMRLTSFDFALRDPVPAPAIGDLVQVLEPAWDGTVVSVRKSYTGPPNLSVTYTVTATNDKEAVASPAPFALSDTPDNATSYTYADLEIAEQQTADGLTTNGTLTCWRAGLWPGMTFALTSANFGLVAAEYTVTNVTVTWLEPTAISYAVEFGDAMVTLSAWSLNQVVYAPDGTISGTKITDGSVTTPKLDANVVVANVLSANELVAINEDGITLRDAAGSVSLSSGGFGPPWRRFVQSGVYNGDFYATPPTPDNNIDATNALPYWTFVQASGTAITAISVADGASGSDRAIRFDMAAGAVGDDTYLEQILPINSSRSQNWFYNPRAAFATGGTVSAAKIYVVVQYLQADGTTTTGTSGTSEFTTTSLGTSTVKDVSATANSNVVPASAYYLRVRVGFKRDAAAIGTTESVTLYEVAQTLGTVRVWAADETSPGTYSPGRMMQAGGVLQIDGNYAGATGSAPQMKLYGNGASGAWGTANLMRIGGTSFPASPTTDDVFYRTDLGMLFYYDGTRWLSEQLHTLTLSASAALPNFAATTAYANRCTTPVVVGSDVYLVDHKVGFLILGGGSALSGSHKWVGTVLKNADAGSGDTTITTVNIDSGSSTVYRTVTTSINALLNSGTLHDTIATTWTKTGTPGNLVAYAEMVTYRHVAT